MHRPPPTYTLFPYTTLFRSVIPGATSTILTKTGLQTSDSGSYTVDVTNPGGTASATPATLTVSPGLVTSTDRKSTRLNSSHRCISYAVFCLKKKNKNIVCNI